MDAAAVQEQEKNVLLVSLASRYSRLAEELKLEKKRKSGSNEERERLKKTVDELSARLRAPRTGLTPQDAHKYREDRKSVV